MNGILETKDGGSILDIDVSSRKVSGYLASFRDVDSDNDIFQKGSFSKSILERKDQIFFLNQHKWDQPLGKFQELEEDEKGLRFVADVVNTSYGEDLLKLYNSGIIEQHSVGFQTVKSDRSMGNPRVITESKLYEGSAVTLGANSNTPFTGFKSGLKDINNKVNNIMKVLKSGSLTDETFLQLELALKQLQSKSYELGKHSNEVEPSPDTRTDYEPLSKIINNLTF